MPASHACFAHLTLATRNVAQSAAFYQQALGFEPIDRPDNIVGGAAWLEIAPGQQLHLLEVENFEPTDYEREFGRHIAIYYPLAEFTMLKSRLTQAGAELIAPQRETPFERFFFRDPDGYVWEVVERDSVPDS